MSKQITFDKLNKLYFDYIGYFWCETILTVGDVSSIRNNLEIIAKEFKLNLLSYENDHDLELLPRFVTIVNPEFLNNTEKFDFFDYIYNFYDEDVFLLTKKTDNVLLKSKDRVIIPEDILTYEYLKTFLLKLLINKHGKYWLFEPIDEIIL